MAMEDIKHMSQEEKMEEKNQWLDSLVRALRGCGDTRQEAVAKLENKMSDQMLNYADEHLNFECIQVYAQGGAKKVWLAHYVGFENYLL